MVKKAPLAFVFVLLVGAVIGYVVSNTRHGDRINFLNDQLNILQKELERRSNDKRESGVQHNIPFSTYMSPDDQVKRLNRDQSKSISLSIGLIQNQIGRLVVARHLTAESVMFSEDIIKALERSGLELEKDLFPPDDPTQTGVMLSCDDPGNVPDSLIKLIEIFRRADIDVRVINMLRAAKNQGVTGCMLFIGPNPL